LSAVEAEFVLKSGKKNETGMCVYDEKKWEHFQEQAP
jgi:hypothetical protein